jgi:hypothetical protein
MKRAIEMENPDLIVLGGDNVMGSAPSLILDPSAVRSSIDQFMEPIVTAKVPFALVFGNHDAETVMSKQKQLQHYLGLRGCLAEENRIGDRVGNYSLLLKNSWGEPFFNLWFFDSGNNTNSEYGSGYAYVTKEQQQWFKDTSKRIGDVPSIVFQHIPVPEIYDMLMPTTKENSSAVEGHGRWSGRFFAANPEYITEGNLGEGPCPPDHNEGEFQRWKEEGTVIGAVFGHDHVNDFSGVLDGIRMMYTPGIGFYSYGNGYHRGVRVIEIEENKPEQFVSRVIYFSDLLEDEIPQELMYNGEINTYILQWVLIGLGLLVIVTLPIVLMIVRAAQRRGKRGRRLHGEG